MKKFSAISIAAFYLLLTTGLYVCILHCTADFFLGTHQTETASHSENSDHHKDPANDHSENSDHHQKAPTGKKDKGDCDGDANCSCCNQHGQYAVKENIQTSPKIHLAVASLSLGVTSILTNPAPQTETVSITWPQSNAPPFLPKQPLYISNRSILI